MSWGTAFAIYSFQSVGKWIPGLNITPGFSSMICKTDVRRQSSEVHFQLSQTWLANLPCIVNNVFIKYGCALSPWFLAWETWWNDHVKRYMSNRLVQEIYSGIWLSCMIEVLAFTIGFYRGKWLASSVWCVISRSSISSVIRLQILPFHIIIPLQNASRENRSHQRGEDSPRNQEAGRCRPASDAWPFQCSKERSISSITA